MGGLLPGIFGEAANLYSGLNNTIAGVKANLRPGLFGEAADIYNGVNETVSRVDSAFPASKAELRADNKRLEAELHTETVQRQSEYDKSQTLLNALVEKVNSLTPVSPTHPSFPSFHTSLPYSHVSAHCQGKAFNAFSSSGIQWDKWPKWHQWYDWTCWGDRYSVAPSLQGLSLCTIHQPCE